MELCISFFPSFLSFILPASLLQELFFSPELPFPLLPFPPVFLSSPQPCQPNEIHGSRKKDVEYMKTISKRTQSLKLNENVIETTLMALD